MTLIAFVFPKLGTAKDLVGEVSKKPRFRRPFDKLHGKRFQRQFRWKKSLFVICKILRTFVNTLTGDDKYSLVSRNNLTEPIDMQ